MRVLVVEDDPGTRLFMREVIRKFGCEVHEADNGAEGLETFRDLKPDLVFSDINMPKMDGLELLAKIREKDLHAVVVMNSTLDAPEYTLKALRLKANDYLVKPVLEKDVIQILQKFKDTIDNRTKDREVLGMIFRRDLGMNIFNRIDLVGKIVDRLMQETEGLLLPEDKLGIHLGLVEMLINAIEHGNLGITYDEKSRALEMPGDALLRLAQERAGAEPFSRRKVTLEYHLNETTCEWVITDEGEGFDWTKVPDPNDPANILQFHGRGIFLTKLSFDVLEYRGNGNQVRMVKKVAPPSSKNGRILPV